MQELAETTAPSNMRGIMLLTRMAMHTMHSWWAPGTLHPWPQYPCSGANKFLVERDACLESFLCPGDSLPGHVASRGQISSANLSGVSRQETKRGLPLIIIEGIFSFKEPPCLRQKEAEAPRS